MNFKIFLLIISCFSFIACFVNDDDDGGGDIGPGISSLYEPIIMDRNDFENSILFSAPAMMKNAGKIYLKDQWMLLGDTHLGFHIYKNSEPESPINFKFLKIPGATDLAVKENVIYVNQATDLVAFHFDPQSNEITIFKRIENAFPPLVSPDGFLGEVGENEVVVGWELID